MTRKRMKVLVAYDGSSDANAAIDDLVNAGLPHDVEALVATVCDSPTVVPFAGYNVIDRTVVGDRVRALVSHGRTRVSHEANRATDLALYRRRFARRQEFVVALWQQRFSGACRSRSMLS